MRRFVTHAFRLAATGAVLQGAACDRARLTDFRLARVDTLPGGVVVVSNPAKGLWASTTAWRLEEDLRLGAAEGDPMETFGRVTGLQLDPAGRIYVLDGVSQEIRVFDREGRFERLIGRKGSGPGEFKEGIGMSWDPRGNLWVADQGNARFTVFDAETGAARTKPRPMNTFTFAWRGGITEGGAIYDFALIRRGTAYREAVMRYDTSGSFSDTLLLPEFTESTFDIRAEKMQAVVAVPYAPRRVWQLDPRGYVWIGVANRYEIVQQTLAGDTARIVKRAWDPIPVEDAERDSAIAALERSFSGYRADASRVPRSKPAFERFDLDDHAYLWVATPRQRGVPGTAFDVFDPDGLFLGTVAVPTAISWYAPLVIRGGSLLTVTTDEAGVEYVVRVRIGGRR